MKLVNNTSPYYAILMNNVPYAFCEDFILHDNTFFSLLKVYYSTLEIWNFKLIGGTMKGNIALFDAEFSTLFLKNSTFALKSFAKNSQLESSKRSTVNLNEVDIILPSLNFTEVKIWKIHEEHQGEITRFSLKCGAHFSPEIKRFDSSIEIVCSRCPAKTYSMSAGSFILKKLENLRSAFLMEQIYQELILKELIYLVLFFLE